VQEDQNSGFSMFVRFQHHCLHYGKRAITVVARPVGLAAKAPARPQATEHITFSVSFKD